MLQHSLSNFEDVGAQGIMISTSGFDRGAKNVARQKNILLQTYTEAKNMDWKSLIGEGWLTITKARLEDSQAFVILGSHRSLYKVRPLNLALFDKDGNARGGLHDLFWDYWDAQPRPRSLGFLEATLISDESNPFYIKIQDRPFIADGFIVKGTMVARKCVVNLQIASGKLLKDDNTGEAKYAEVTSDGFILKSFENQITTPVTKEEWHSTEMDSQGYLPVDDSIYRFILSSGSNE